MLRILLIEDNLDDELLTVRTLRKIERPAEIEVARDGHLGMVRIQDPDLPVPSVVLLDLNLPKVNGIEILQIVRSDDRTNALPIIALVTSDEPDDLKAEYQEKATATMHKPIDLEEFQSILASLHI